MRQGVQSWLARRGLFFSVSIETAPGRRVGAELATIANQVGRDCGWDYEPVARLFELVDYLGAHGR